MALKVGDLIVSIGATMRNMSSQFKAAEKKLKVFGDRMKSAGTSLTMGLTVPMAAVGGIAFKAIASFDKAMTTSTAIIEGMTDEMRARMEEAARAMAKESVFSANEIAEAYYYLASAGMTVEQSIAALPTVIKFATAGQFDLATATSLLADSQSALGLSSQNAVKNMEEMTRVSDVLTKANILANASVEQFATALTTDAANAFRVVGKDVEEAVAALAVLANVGIKAQEAGTMLTMAMRDLQTKAIENASAFERLNVRVYEAGEMRHLADIVEDLENVLRGAGDELKKTTLAQLGFTDRSLKALLALIGFSDKIRDWDDALRNAGGTTQTVADKQLRNLHDQFILLWHAMQDVAITLGKALMPVFVDLREALVGITEILGGIINIFAEFPEKMRGLIGKFGGFLALLGPMAFALGTLAATLRGLMVTLKLMVPLLGRTLFGPWGFVAFGVTQLAASFLKLKPAVDDVNRALEEFADVQSKMRAREYLESIAEVERKAAAAEREYEKLKDEAREFGEETNDAVDTANKKFEDLQQSLQDLKEGYKALRVEPALAGYRDALSDISTAWRESGDDQAKWRAEIEALIPLIKKHIEVYGEGSIQVKAYQAHLETLKTKLEDVAKTAQAGREALLDPEAWKRHNAQMAEIEQTWLRTGETARYMEDEFRANERAIEAFTAKAIEANEVSELLADETFVRLIDRQNELKEAMRQPFGDYDWALAREQLDEWAVSMQLTATDVVQSIRSIFEQLTQGIGDAIGRAIVYGENLGEAMTNILKEIGVAFISMLTRLAIEAIASLIIGAAAISAAGAQKIGTEMAYGAVAAAASAYAGAPWPANLFAGPAAGASALAAMTALSTAAFGLGKAQAAAGMPAFAQGGLVLSPTVALVGESGPEAIIPLSHSKIHREPTMTLLLDIEGRPVARAVVPYLPGEVRRLGVKGL